MTRKFQQIYELSGISYYPVLIIKSRKQQIKWQMSNTGRSSSSGQSRNNIIKEKDTQFSSAVESHPP